MKSTSLGIVLTIITFSAAAAKPADKPKSSSDSAWVEVVSVDTHTFSARKGSFEISQTKAGIPIALVLGQVMDKKTTQMQYRKWYVTKDDCLAGMGKLVQLDTDGNYISEVDYVADGESAGSVIADTICRIYKGRLEEDQSKGL